MAKKNDLMQSLQSLPMDQLRNVGYKYRVKARSREELIFLIMKAKKHLERKCYHSLSNFEENKRLFMRR